MKIKILLVSSICWLLNFSCGKDCTQGAKTKCIPTTYNPVCGCNNVTYDNANFAKCDGINDYTSGVCK